MADVANILEVLDLAIGVLEGLVNAKADDDKISMIESASIALKNAGAAVKAISGVGEIAGEAQDIDAQELKVIAEKVVRIGELVVALFGSK